jgi:hypothetical protein
MRRAAGSGLTTAIILVAMLTEAQRSGRQDPRRQRPTPRRIDAQRGLGVLIPKTKGERLPTRGGTAGYNPSDLIRADTAEDSAPSNPLLGDQYHAW